MGERGPAPRREDERRRRNKPERPVTKLTQDELNQLPFEVDYTPEPPEVADLDPAGEQWHPLVRSFWDDMKRDPARKWMTSGDWGALAIFMETLSRELNEQAVGTEKETGEMIVKKLPPKGATLTAFLKMLEHIGISESARLRIGKEVTLFPLQPAESTPDGKVVPISEGRKGAVQ